MIDKKLQQEIINIARVYRTHIQFENGKLTTQSRNNLIKNVYWYIISNFRDLSENFMEEFKDQICWQSISWNQRLSENFIKKFQNKIDWSAISYKQNLSEKFIIEFYNKINFQYLINNKKIDKKIKDKYTLIMKIVEI